ncbi:MAG: AzlC family ABC transporter permease [Pseudomonadota bacterium]
MERSAKTVFWNGFRDAIPFILVIVPFGTLFGVVGTEAGWNVAQVMAATFLVIAGASQFTAVALWADNTPLFFILLTSLAVNLRMAMYSAALVPHFGKAPLGLRALLAYAIVDQNFAMGTKKYEEEPDLTWQEKVAYFIGMFVFIAPFWYTCTYLGAVFGAAIPESFALDFATPILFIALIAPLLRTLPNLVAALCSIVFALALNEVPYSLGLIIAAVIAMVAGAQTELWLDRRSMASNG